MSDKTIPECPFEAMYPSYMNLDDEFYMKIAYNQALLAWKEGEVPVGAVIEYEGQIIASSHNMVEQTADPTAHAEMLAITQATNKIGDWRLNEATLYVTKEPCPMCSGACVMARIGRVVYALEDKKMGLLGGALDISQIKTFNHNIQISKGVLEEDCSNLLKAFFAAKRQQNKNKE